MSTKQEWISKMIEQGAIDPASNDGKVTTCYPGEYLEKFEVVEIAWAFKYSDEDSENKNKEFSKIRNRFARQMRKDGWTVECESYDSMWDERVIKLSGERPKKE